MQVLCDVLDPGQRIPIKYTADGDNVSPPLRWSDVPERAQELALTVEDISGGQPKPFVQWVIYKIDPTWGELPEGLQHATAPREPPVVQGKNSLHNVGYNGPAPPVGRPHRYSFHLYALDKPLEADPKLDKESLLATMAGHIVDEAELVANYERPR